MSPKCLLSAVMAAVLLSGSPGLAAPAATLPAADKQYVLRYGDSINLYVVENEKLAIQNQPIRPDGRVSMPLIGEVIAGGLTLPQLTERVAKSYTKFFVDPHVVVNVATFRALSATFSAAATTSLILAPRTDENTEPERLPRISVLMSSASRSSLMISATAFPMRSGSCAIHASTRSGSFDAHSSTLTENSRRGP